MPILENPHISINTANSFLSKSLTSVKNSKFHQSQLPSSNVSLFLKHNCGDPNKNGFGDIRIKAQFLCEGLIYTTHTNSQASK